MSFYNRTNDKLVVRMSLDTPTSQVQEAFQFPLATAMHQAGQSELLNVVEVDGQWHCTFSGVGEAFSKAPGLNVANPDALPHKMEVLR